jgi:hypothetical protein
MKNGTNASNARSACALAYSTMVKSEIGEELVQSTVVSGHDRLYELQAEQKEQKKQELVQHRQRMMLKKGATIGGARLFGRIVKPPPTRKFFEAEDIDNVELTLLKDLRALYDTRDKDNEDSLDNVDENLYTDLALLQREAIRFTPEVQIVIGELFEAVDTDFSESIEEDEYKELVIVLYECLRLFWDEDLSELANEELTAIAHDDWAVDAGGYEHIDFDRFVIAMFKLCDVWTDFIDGETYLEFLIALRGRLTTMVMFNGHERRVLRTKEQIMGIKKMKDASTAEQQKVEAITSLFDTKTKRWPPDPQLSMWLSKGAQAKLLQGKAPEVVSTMVIKYLERYCVSSKGMWKGAVTSCQESLREHSVAQRKAKKANVGKTWGLVKRAVGVGTKKKGLAEVAMEALAEKKEGKEEGKKETTWALVKGESR